MRFNNADSEATNDMLYLLMDDFEIEFGDGLFIEEIGAEYRPFGTDDWTVIESILLDNIPVFDDPDHAQYGEPMSVGVYWSIAGIPDGEYEIRPYSLCSSGRVGGLPARGRIDREAPEALSIEPADEVLALGDAISITFNEAIDCEQLEFATVTLEIEEEGDNTPIDVTTTCNGTTIVITAVFPSLDELEGRTLTATVEGIKDSVNNPMAESVAWSFDVTRGQFTWAQASVYKDAAYRAPGSISATLVNGSDDDLTFDLEGLAEWLIPDPASATIIAGQSVTVNFTIADSLSIGSHVDSLTAVVFNPPLESELEIRVDVSCQPPAWAVNSADYQYTMTAVIELSIDEQLSDDPNDIVVGFVGNEVRGVAQLELLEGLNKAVAFMNIFSNREGGENVRFQIYDDSECFHYNAASNFLLFEKDRRYGTPAQPVTLRALDVPEGDLQTVPLNAGWTWFSVNLVDSLDMSVITILGDLNPQPGDIIKTVRGGNGFVSEYDGTLGWIGSLVDLSVRESYAISLAEGGTIIHQGQPANTDIPIPLIDGWNWIGFPRSGAMSTDFAMQSLTVGDGDVVKSTSGFDEYVSGLDGWYGNLGGFEPGGGYKLYIDDATGAGGWLDFPDAPLGDDIFASAASLPRGSELRKSAKRNALGAKSSKEKQGKGVFAKLPDTAGRIGNRSDGNAGSDWQMNYGYQFDMTLTAMIQVEDRALGANAGRLAAFVGDEPRGYSELIYIAPLNAYCAFRMVQSDRREGETVSFRFYDGETGGVMDVEETIEFNTDAVGGTLREPFVMRAEPRGEGPGLPILYSLSRIFPNPVIGTSPSIIQWSIPKQEHVSLKVYDVRGRNVRTVVDNVMAPGLYTEQITTHGLSSGIYLYRLKAGEFVKKQKFMVVK